MGCLKKWYIGNWVAINFYISAYLGAKKPNIHRISFVPSELWSLLNPRLFSYGDLAVIHLSCFQSLVVPSWQDWVNNHLISQNTVFSCADQLFAFQILLIFGPQIYYLKGTRLNKILKRIKRVLKMEPNVEKGNL